MADRRTDQAPGSAGPAPGAATRAPAASEKPRESPREATPREVSSSRDEARRPISERVSAAVSSAGSTGQVAPPSAAGSGSTKAPSPAPAARRTGRVRKARLRLVHLDPWSVMKTSFLLSIAFGIVTVVAVAVVWTVLGAAGVWDSINDTVVDVVGTDSASNWDIEDYLGMSRVMGFTMVVAVVDIVLITVIATLSAFLYNLAASLLGGLEMIWAEDDGR